MNLWRTLVIISQKNFELKMIKFLIVFAVCQLSLGSIIKRSTESFTLKNATQFESPWLALINIKVRNLRCGGSLVKDKFIITAAHCFDGININSPTLKKDIMVVLGEWKTDSDPDCVAADDSCERVAEIPPKKIVIHEQYPRDTRRNKHKHDIAIIQLAWAPRKSELIENIDLTDGECDDNYEDEELFVTGFGHTPTSGKEYAKIKKSIKMSIQTEKYCGENLKDSFVRGIHMCGLGTEGETTCPGDSGSGVTSYKNDIHMLEGLVAYGVATCKAGNKPCKTISQ
ncbi:hypothetical protein ACKWTF_014229 [Chironomus riparius]